MKFHFIAFVFLFLSSSILRASELPKFCSTVENQISQCNQKQKSINLSPLPKEIEEYGYINLEIEKNFKVNELTRFSLVQLDQNIANPADQTIGRMYSKFNLLALLTAELKASQERYNICFKNCSRSRLVEIADDIKKLQKARMALLMSEPLLSSEYFEDIIDEIKPENLDDKPIVKKEHFEKALHITLKDNIKVMNDKRAVYLDYLKTLNTNTIHDKNKEDIIKTHPLLIKEVLITQSLNHKQLDPNQKNIICKKYRDFIKEEEKEIYTGYAIDTALLILPLLAGPLFPLAEEGMLIRYVPKLSRFGMSRESTILKDLEVAAGLGSDTVGLGKAVGEQVTYSKNCHHSELIFIQNPKQEILEKVKKCQNNYYSDLIASEVGAAFGIGSLGNNTRNAILQIRNLAH